MKQRQKQSVSNKSIRKASTSKGRKRRIKIQYKTKTEAYNAAIAFEAEAEEANMGAHRKGYGTHLSFGKQNMHRAIFKYVPFPNIRGFAVPPKTCTVERSFRTSCRGETCQMMVMLPRV